MEFATSVYCKPPGTLRLAHVFSHFSFRAVPVVAVPPTPQNTMNSIKRERVKASVADPDDHPVHPVIHGKPIQFIGRFYDLNLNSREVAVASK